VMRVAIPLIVLPASFFIRASLSSTKDACLSTSDTALLRVCRCWLWVFTVFTTSWCFLASVRVDWFSSLYPSMSARV
jgi:hypothetical protein